MTPQFISNLLRLAMRHPAHFGHQINKRIRFWSRHHWIDKNAYMFDKDVPMPLSYGIELTSRCNLRCSMCYEWGERGWYRNMPESARFVDSEMGWGLFQKFIEQTASARPLYTLWGGEPLMYSHFDDAVKMISECKCFCYICTNGTLLSEHKREILGNKYLSFIVSIDGLEKENDEIRGKGMFQRVISNVKELKRTPRRSPYMGAELTILPHNVHILEEFCDQMSRIGFDWIVLNLGWFISTEQKEKYEKYMGEAFGITPTAHFGYYNPNFNLDRKIFKEQFQKIKKRKFPALVTWMPPMKSGEEINAYIDEPENPLIEPFCNKQWMQADIRRDGSVVACKDWPDYVVGNLKAQSLKEIWNSNKYKKFRRTICENGLMPICSKCYALTLYRDRLKGRS